MKWIEMRHVGKSESGITDRWAVLPKEDDPIAIGMVSWYPSWRKYVFSPKANTVFEEDCLRDIADFCEAKTKEHRAVRKAAMK